MATAKHGKRKSKVIKDLNKPSLGLIATLSGMAFSFLVVVFFALTFLTGHLWLGVVVVAGLLVAAAYVLVAIRRDRKQFQLWAFVLMSPKRFDAGKF